jgi:hypothetical protein
MQSLFLFTSCLRLSRLDQLSQASVKIITKCGATSATEILPLLALGFKAKITV